MSETVVRRLFDPRHDALVAGRSASSVPSLSFSINHSKVWLPAVQWALMGHTVQADEHGALVVPAELLGNVCPGTRYAVEPHGDVLILRREGSDARQWWSTTTPAQRAAWLEAWVGSLPPAPPLPREATRRDSMYD
ncbi:MAG: hypothetical protein AAB225_27530 [Acidobacteriota bacterium]